MVTVAYGCEEFVGRVAEEGRKTGGANLLLPLLLIRWFLSTVVEFNLHCGSGRYKGIPTCSP